MQNHALPVSPRNAALWIVVTVRVAWEFVNAGIRLSSTALSEAREHVLRSMPAEGLDTDRAELLAKAFTQEYLRRLRHQEYGRITEMEDIDVIVPRGWAIRLEGTITQVEEAVYRLHFGDGLSLDEIQKRYPQLELSRLIAGRDGIRELARSYAVEDGHVAHRWPDERLDRLIGRVASRPKGSCPSPQDLLMPMGLQHADQCPACSRAVRLIRGGVIQTADLYPESHSNLDVVSHAGVLAVLLHPDARKHRKRLKRALGPTAMSVGTDAWLVPESDLDEVIPLIKILCEEGTPHRHHLRGVKLRGCGRWSRGALLGPVAVEALEAAKGRTWADMGSACELPVALPPPPKATSWWVAAALAGVAVIWTWKWVNQDPPDPPETPIEASFTQLDYGWNIRFDTPNLATVDVVVLEQGAMRIHREEIRAAKGVWATGEGDYELAVPGEQVLLVSSPNGVPELSSMVMATSRNSDPLDALATQILNSHPSADVQISERSNGNVPPIESQANARP